MIERKIHFSDHLEKQVADVLETVGIEFVHESETSNQDLDFYLPDYDVYIEVKQYHADRIAKQCASKENVIVLQGKKAVDFFNLLGTGH